MKHGDRRDRQSPPCRASRRGHSGTRQSSQKIDDASPDTKEQLAGQAFDQSPAGTNGRVAAEQIGRNRPRPAPILLEEDIHDQARARRARPRRAVALKRTRASPKRAAGGEIARQHRRDDDRDDDRQIVEEIADRLPEGVGGGREDAAGDCLRPLRAGLRGEEQRRDPLVDPRLAVEHQRQRDPQRQQRQQHRPGSAHRPNRQSGLAPGRWPSLFFDRPVRQRFCARRVPNECGYWHPARPARQAARPIRPVCIVPRSAMRAA